MTITTPALVGSLLTDEMLTVFDERAPVYDRENRFFTEDFEDLRASGYLLAAVPTELGGFGLSLAELAPMQRRLAYHAPATAVAINMHLYWARLLSEAVDTPSTVGWTQPLGRLVEAATVLAAHTGDAMSAALLTGAGTTRFMTPRWYVDITALLDAERDLAREADPTAWDAGVGRGADMTDDEVFDVVRRVVAAAG